MRKIKAIVLFSGGLDSLLAVKMLQGQNLDVEGICFKSNFFNCDKARIGARNVKIKLHEIDISKEILKLTKNPPHGHGKNMNPCIDCHGLMFKKANNFMLKKVKSEKIPDLTFFIASGEVLGQRPFSQNKNALEEVKKVAGVEILRPLSAQLLRETEIERDGLVDRLKLGKILGRTREEQFKLAKKYKIKNFPTPSGGCLLTDPGFSLKLGKMIEFWPNCTTEDVEILKYGRVFWLDYREKEKILVIIGRHNKDNEKLKELTKKGDFMVELKDVTGPVSIIRFKNNLIKKVNRDNLKLKIPVELNPGCLGSKFLSSEELLGVVALITGWYSTKTRNKTVDIKIKKLT